MRIPGATYRVQFHPQFRFEQALDLIPRLRECGITHLYASPIFEARQGSTHGYDAVDPNRIRAELGGPEGFAQLSGALQAAGMGLLLDIVPNHMAASSENQWWMDVLENGAGSRYANFFGIRWGRQQTERETHIVLPILGSWYAEALETGQLQLVFHRGSIQLAYHEHRMPIDVSHYARVLGTYEGLPAALDRLPARTATDWEAHDLRQREKENIKQQLAGLYDRDPAFRHHVEDRLKSFNSDPEALHALLEDQPYRLAFWRVATERVNYRRFFDVADLIGVRVQDPDVLRLSHRLIFELVAAGAVDGLRIDHIDGMFHPKAYLEALPRDTYLVVEKILGDGERLPLDWAGQGTTGYDFLGMVNGLFVDPSGLANLESFYRNFTGLQQTRAEIEYERKKLAIQQLFAGEMQDLGDYLVQISGQDRHARDLSYLALATALAEITACMQVYRTYVSGQPAGERDRSYIGAAINLAKQKRPDLDEPLFEFIRRVMDLRIPEGADDSLRADWVRFVMRWQQLTAPVMAKGVEDSALYVYNPLLSLNEVGGVSRAVSPQELHTYFRERQTRWPHTMNATSTHDTKRSEDVRARLNVLTEIVPVWKRAVGRWRRWSRDQRGGVDANEEYFLYQTLAGAWPLDAGDTAEFRHRIHAYLIKSAREARVHSSWLHPCEAHETAWQSYASVLLDDPRFLDEFRKVFEPVSLYGAINSLAQLTLKITAPGVPDFYQGTLSWSFTLVDPDNRRPVHPPVFPRADAKPEDLLSGWQDGQVKTFLTAALLRFRSTHPDLFDQGHYIPLEVEGDRGGNVFAFARRHTGRWLIVAVPRLAASLSSVVRPPLGTRAWRNTAVRLPEDAPGQFHNLLTKERTEAAEGKLPLSRLLSRFPIAVLFSQT